MWRNYYCLQDPDPLPTPYFSVPSTPTEKIEDRLNLLIELKLELEDGELKTEVDDGSFLCCVAFNQTILVFGGIKIDMTRPRFSKLSQKLFFFNTKNNIWSEIKTSGTLTPPEMAYHTAVRICPQTCQV